MAARVPLGELLPVLAMEARRRMLMLGTMFAIIAITALVIGISLPRRYESSTTILVQESSVATALMDGHAVTAGGTDRVAIARELISDRKVMNEILAAGGGPEQQASAVDQDRMIEAIGDRITISSPRDNLIRISYSDADPARSLHTTQRLAELFVRESLAAKERESRNVFDFIDGQVATYQKKLTAAEDTLKVYRQAAANAPRDADDANARVIRLLGQIEQTRAELMEQHAHEGALVSQLSDQAEPPATPSRAQPANAAGSGHEEPYEALHNQLADARRDSAATATRLDEAEALLKAEIDGSKGGPRAGNELAGLTRDYEVNRGIHADLLRRREIARVSMDLDAGKQGLTFRVQQPATMPQRPSGLRLMHFAIAGLVLALLLPLGLLFGYARFDRRVRSAAQLERMAGLPVLATIPAYPTPVDRRRATMHAFTLAAIIAIVMLCYAVTYLVQLEASP